MWAVAVFVLGMLTTFTADHFIRPVLIGGATKLPFLWVLLGILGGVEAVGPDRAVRRPGGDGRPDPALARVGRRRQPGDGVRPLAYTEALILESAP